jgi:glycosyltransferase involved in cell wall biosynthesis
MVANGRLEILIPTYNRAGFLDRNLSQLEAEIEAHALDGLVSMLVSDNASEDETGRVLARHAAQVRGVRQQTNVGLARNALEVLRQADHEFVLFLGDDDFLPAGYLGRVLELIDGEKALSCILPGIRLRYPDGRWKVARPYVCSERRYSPGYLTALRLAHLGHQLSGLVIRREGVIEAYAANPELHNIYPFVFFAGSAMARGVTWYVPQWQVDVTVGTPKDWRYDRVHLVGEAVKNFGLLYPREPSKRLIASWLFVAQQAWRLGVGRGAAATVRGCWAFVRMEEIDWRVRLALPALIPAAYAHRLSNAIAFLIMRLRGIPTRSE